jgi:CRISPR-associated protein Csb2
MLALAVRYLNGVVAAAAPDDRERPEWPPHPARVFTAVAAAHLETGADPHERRAPLWLERLRPPEGRARGAIPRAVVTHSVGVKDKRGARRERPTASIQFLSQLARACPARAFARARLEDETAYLVRRARRPRSRGSPGPSRASAARSPVAATPCRWSKRGGRAPRSWAT